MSFRIRFADLEEIGCVKILSLQDIGSATLIDQAEKRICVPRELPSMIRVLDERADTIPCPPPSVQQEASW